jgi:hypothetical protein
MTCFLPSSGLNFKTKEIPVSECKYMKVRYLWWDPMIVMARHFGLIPVVDLIMRSLNWSDYLFMIYMLIFRVKQYSVIEIVIKFP